MYICLSICGLSYAHCLLVKSIAPPQRTFVHMCVCDYAYAPTRKNACVYISRRRLNFSGVVFKLAPFMDRLVFYDLSSTKAASNDAPWIMCAVDSK